MGRIQVDAFKPKGEQDIGTSDARKRWEDGPHECFKCREVFVVGDPKGFITQPNQLYCS
jgi:hypothetical protein